MYEWLVVQPRSGLQAFEQVFFFDKQFVVIELPLIGKLFSERPFVITGFVKAYGEGVDA